MAALYRQGTFLDGGFGAHAETHPEVILYKILHKTKGIKQEGYVMVGSQ